MCCCVGVVLLLSAIVCFLSNLMLFFPNGNILEPAQISFSVYLLGGLMGGGLAMLVPSYSRIVGCGCAEVLNGVPGLIGALYCFCVSALGLIFGPKCQVKGGGWEYPFLHPNSTCEYPENAVKWHMEVFYVLLGVALLQLVLLSITDPESLCTLLKGMGMGLVACTICLCTCCSCCWDCLRKESSDKDSGEGRGLLNGQRHVMYHGTTRQAAKAIKKSGFLRSAGGMLGPGVYLSKDLEKARCYPLTCPDRDRVIMKVEANVGKVKKIDHQNHRLQRNWHEHGYDTAWVPPSCGMVNSGREENCVWDPKRIKLLDVMKRGSFEV